jgi:hypothetical protein
MMFYLQKESNRHNKCKLNKQRNQHQERHLRVVVIHLQLEHCRPALSHRRLLVDPEHFRITPDLQEPLEASRAHRSQHLEVNDEKL